MTIGIGGWGSRRKPMSRGAGDRPLRRDATSRSSRAAAPTSGCSARRQGGAGRVRVRLARLDPARAALPGGGRVGPGRDGAARRGHVSTSGCRRRRGGCRSCRRGSGSAPTCSAANPELRTVRSPYDDGEGEELVAAPAIELDVALVHMNRGDAARQRPVPRRRPVLRRPDAPGRGRSGFMSVEQIVATDDLARRGPDREPARPASSDRRRRRGAVTARTSRRARPTTSATRRSSASTPPAPSRPRRGRRSARSTSTSRPTPSISRRWVCG